MRRLWLFLLVILILEFLLVFALTLRVQRALEAPAYYLGSTLPAEPLHVAGAGPVVLGPGQGEEQIG